MTGVWAQKKQTSMQIKILTGKALKHTRIMYFCDCE